MKYVFFGTPEFATIILEKLIKAELMPEAIICNPDRPVGRKQIITSPPVKSLIMKHATCNIPVLQPEKLDESFMLHVSSFMPDIFIVAAYSQILAKQILEIPRLGTIGVHPSLLPKYRGATPIQTAILNGDEETGVSLFLIDEEMDHGPILMKSETQISKSETYESLHDKLAELGAELLIKTLPDFVAGKITPLAQDESQATYTKKFKTEDAFIDLAALQLAMRGEPRPDGREKAIEIERKIRALNPEPGVWTILNGKRTKILEAILTLENKLKLKKIQFEGKNPMAYN
jgi:methionyl-tRNA formyltransferase